LATEAEIDGGSRLVLQVPEAGYNWLETDSINWRQDLAQRIGQRFRVVAGNIIDVYKDD